MFQRKNHVKVFATVTKHDDNASKEVGQLFLLSGVISVVDWGKSITFHYNSFKSYVRQEARGCVTFIYYQI